MDFVRERLGRPQREKAFLIMPVGYPAAGAQVPDLQRKAIEQVASGDSRPVRYNGLVATPRTRRVMLS